MNDTDMYFSLNVRKKYKKQKLHSKKKRDCIEFHNDSVRAIEGLASEQL